MTDKLLYCQSDTSDSVRHFSYDSLKAKNAKQRFFEVALNNEPCLGSSYINSCNAAELEELLFDAANLNIPNKRTLNTAEATASSNIPNKRDVFPQYVEDKYEDLEINTSYTYDPATSICATYLWTENVGYLKDLITATAYTEGYKLWFKQGRFPIGIDGEATAHLLDNTPIPVKTLIDSGTSRPILSKHFYDTHPFLHTYPRYKIPARGMVIGNDTVLPCDEAIAIMVKFSGHVFHMIRCNPMFKGLWSVCRSKGHV